MHVLRTVLEVRLAVPIYHWLKMQQPVPCSSRAHVSAAGATAVSRRAEGLKIDAPQGSRLNRVYDRLSD
jgi:hypothetical protein